MVQALIHKHLYAYKVEKMFIQLKEMLTIELVIRSTVSSLISGIIPMSIQQIESIRIKPIKTGSNRIKIKSNQNKNQTTDPIRSAYLICVPEIRHEGQMCCSRSEPNRWLRKLIFYLLN